MKKEYIKFNCDMCNKHITVEKENGFPYEKGWCYIYNFSGKVLQNYAPGIDLAIGNYDIKDKHFCCLNCQNEYLNKIIEKASDYTRTDNYNNVTEL